MVSDEVEESESRSRDGVGAPGGVVDCGGVAGRPTEASDELGRLSICKTQHGTPGCRRCGGSFGDSV